MNFAQRSSFSEVFASSDWSYASFTAVYYSSDRSYTPFTMVFYPSDRSYTPFTVVFYPSDRSYTPFTVVFYPSDRSYTPFTMVFYPSDRSYTPFTVVFFSSDRSYGSFPQYFAHLVVLGVPPKVLSLGNFQASLVFRSLSRTLAFRRRYFRSEKPQTSLVFRSLSRTFAAENKMWIDLGCLQPLKKMLKNKSSWLDCIVTPNSFPLLIINFSKIKLH